MFANGSKGFGQPSAKLNWKYCDTGVYNLRSEYTYKGNNDLSLKLNQTWNSYQIILIREWVRFLKYASWDFWWSDANIIYPCLAVKITNKKFYFCLFRPNFDIIWAK